MYPSHARPPTRNVPSQFLQQFEHARLLLKVLRIMVVQGVSDHDQLPHVVEFFGKLVERHQMLLQLRENMADAHAGRLSESVDKSITLAHKVGSLLKLHLMAFRDWWSLFCCC